MAAVLTTSGRIGIATAIKARTAHHLAWGSGDPAWGSNPPSPPGDASALVAEVARRKATQVEFCVADPAGAISVPEGRFSISASPTRALYFKFHFEFEEGVGSTIRELGIFLDTVAAAGVPSGQFYLTPAQVAQQGTMLVLERRPPIVREVTTRQLFEYVVLF
jgi:hypothetical protein